MTQSLTTTPTGEHDAKDHRQYDEGGGQSTRRHMEVDASGQVERTEAGNSNGRLGLLENDKIIARSRIPLTLAWVYQWHDQHVNAAVFECRKETGNRLRWRQLRHSF
jgi:hypothetical protein